MTTGIEKVSNNAALFRSYSKSRPGLIHWTWVTEDLTGGCTCEGWVNHRKCWHFTEASQNVQSIQNAKVEDDPFDGIQVSL